MKINIEDYLHSIDSAFKEKTKKDIQMIYVMIFGGIFAFAYLLFWDSSVDEFTKKSEEIVAVQSKINVDKMYLQSNPEAKITQLDRAIKNANMKLSTHKDNNNYIKTKIETISSLIYDERSWGEYLHSISINAQTYDMKILNFTNTYALNNTSFGHVLDITLSAEGNYKDTLKFINSLEQSELVVDIHSLGISSNGILNTDLNISVWGITY